jgi:hypothetical protein
MSDTYASFYASTKESFDNAIHLFATNDDVNNHNKRCLLSLNRPISHSVATTLTRKTYTNLYKENMDGELPI